ncbi:MAG: alpha/beta hydrolase [Chloroflexi bacterium]|nr:alpha/beta hydrolase [Chloroflexota bacterium]MBT4073834.1 alpha/beta hydrolase [Chloroflexota bacterium]MBT4516123.1 alpha/beta hydrolase [Chloroflexota bacterium]MBT5319336.1 alpha/beta hydrolase [Chloroflexota bacterium]MBT6682264.1 alpha/beta hydrolase [Chloroflexota bacterium]
MLKQGTHDTGEVTLNYFEVGEGDPIVLLHGFTSDWRAWSQEIGLLSGRWRVLIPDARGHGDSTGSEDGDYGYGARTRDAASYIKAVVGGPAVVAGHSMGGATAMGVAARHPELTRAVVLEDPHVSGGREVVTEARVWMEGARDLLRTSPSFHEAIAGLDGNSPTKDAAAQRLDASQAIKMDPETWNPFIDGAMFDDYDPGTELSNIKCPVLLVQADPDQGGVVSDEAAEHIRAGVSDCTHVKLDVGHSVHKDAPIEFRRSLFDFLDAI